MSKKSIARQLIEIRDARVRGEPYACGLAITTLHCPGFVDLLAQNVTGIHHKCNIETILSCNPDDLLELLCTYTCPQHYVIHGVQRFLPYAGCVIRFRIKFPQDYPFKPFKLLVSRTSDFFHPLINGDPDTGFCNAMIYHVRLFDFEHDWSPKWRLIDLLRKGLLPM